MSDKSTIRTSGHLQNSCWMTPLNWTEKEATKFFTDTYQSEPKTCLSKLDAISSNPHHWVQLWWYLCWGNLSGCEEIQSVPYIVFKKCPVLVTALHILFTTCWKQYIVPAQWKTASVKLIGKQTAGQDPTLPTNFRSIALTSCVGKLFTTIVQKDGCHLC